MPAEIPIRSFFSFEARCLYRKSPPTIDGALKDWSDEFKLPDLSEVASEASFAEVYTAWNEDGVYLAVAAKGAPGANIDVNRPLKADGFQVWLDTRDVRDAHRAGRYCHHFFFLPGKGQRKPKAGQVRIRRARAHGRVCEPGELVVASRTGRSGFTLGIHLPASVLTGFDPTENRRFGFTYLLKDTKLGRQTWTADDPLPVSYDPSLWGTLELVDG